MSSKFKLIAVAALCGSASIASLRAQAQSPLSGYAKLYDQGVNAYFAGSACRADALLSEALTFNADDPRAYYFRALSLLRQGRLDEAQGDMIVGAILESGHPQRYAVGFALERVQGADRLLLEKFRCQARHDAVEQAAATETRPPVTPAPATTDKHTTAAERAGGVLREKRFVPLDELLRPSPQSIADEPVAAPAPVPPQGNAPQAQPKVQPAETPAAPENPFGDDSEQPAAKSSQPPQSPPQEAPKPATPANPPPETNDENPFGG